MYIWYKQNSLKVLIFISTEGADSNDTGETYLSSFLDILYIF